MGEKEIEIKFRADDVEGLARRLEAAGFYVATSRTHETNTLYDFPGGLLRKRGELLRLRRYGGQWTVTHKGKGAPGRHKQRVETETGVGNGETLEAIFARLGLAPSFRYEKFRTEWTDGHGHVVVDETPIGNFAEIEGTPGWIDRTAEALGVAEAEYITQSYAELFTDWKRRTRSKAQNMTFAECR